MARKVGIVFIAQSKYSAARKDASAREMASELTTQLLGETGLEFTLDGKGIDHTVIVCDEFWDGQTLSEIKYGDLAGAHMRDATRVVQDAAQAVLYAVTSIQSGHVDTVMLLAAAKESMVPSRNRVTNYGYEPLLDRILGMDDTIAASMQARAYMERYGITRDQAALAVVKARQNAKSNPYTQPLEQVTVPDVLGADTPADPIGELDIYPVTDGMVAMILTTEEKAKKLAKKPVWISGMGTYRENYNFGIRDLTKSEALQKAAKKAYRMAGISDPKTEVDLFEISTQYSYQELLYTENIGLCAHGQGGQLIESGATQKGGNIPVNLSGGTLAGNPILVSGGARVLEATKQLSGEAGEMQMDGAKTAVAHGCYGPCGQLQTVIVLNAD